jgi:hypothetical protein
VTVFKAHNVDDQLDNACVRYIDWGLKLDAKKRVILLPKVCDLYRADFEAEDRADLVKVRCAGPYLAPGVLLGPRNVS